MKNPFYCSLFVCVALVPVYAAAANVEFGLAEDPAYPLVEQGDGLAMASDNADTIEESFSRTSKPCPPFCVNPLNIEHDVATVSELDVIKFRENIVFEGKGVLVDTRTSDWFGKETIPGSVNIPFTVFERPMDDPELVAVLERLGAKQRDRVGFFMRTLEKTGLFEGDMKTADWDYTDAKALLLWCNGPWCDQSPRAIRALIDLGYPADRIFYYRGGMQMWQTLGLETVAPADLSSYASK